MSIDDADTAREGSERGRKNERFKELIFSVQMEIREAQAFGSNSTAYKHTSMEFMDELKEYLLQLEYQVRIEGAVLHIDWPNKD